MNTVRKLPKNLECPIDNFLLDIVDYANPYFYTCGLTPNMLTSISALFGVIASINILYNYYVLASIHREENVDDLNKLEIIMNSINKCFLLFSNEFCYFSIR